MFIAIYYLDGISYLKLKLFKELGLYLYYVTCWF